MSKRKELDALMFRLNYALGQNPEAISRDAEGKFHWNVGTYCLGCHAPAGRKIYSIEQITSEGGGVTSLQNGLYVGEAINYVQALLQGIALGRNLMANVQ